MYIKYGKNKRFLIFFFQFAETNPCLCLPQKLKSMPLLCKKVQFDMTTTFVHYKRPTQILHYFFLFDLPNIVLHVQKYHEFLKSLKHVFFRRVFQSINLICMFFNKKKRICKSPNVTGIPGVLYHSQTALKNIIKLIKANNKWLTIRIGIILFQKAL